MKVDVRLPGKGNSISHGARPVHLIITMIKWIRTSRLSIKNSLSKAGRDAVRGVFDASHSPGRAGQGSVFFFLFFISLKPRVESYTKSMSLKYDPASEPLPRFINPQRFVFVPQKQICGDKGGFSHRFVLASVNLWDHWFRCGKPHMV